ncbi:hypothetical protein, partial [Escherichia coli]|uniref:hypothetical protein n=1 Tax=Escherichia coli TaxID=562 RepID=UPI001BDB732E
HRLNALDKDYPILKKSPDDCSGCWKISGNAMAQQKIKSVTIKAYNPRRIIVCIIFDTFTRLIIISEELFD